MLGQLCYDSDVFGRYACAMVFVYMQRHVRSCNIMTEISEFIVKWEMVVVNQHISRKEPWWRHQMEPFSALLALCAGNSPVIGEFPVQRPVTRSFYVFFDLRLKKRLSKQCWGWWFETTSRPLWRLCNNNGSLLTTPDMERNQSLSLISLVLILFWKSRTIYWYFISYLNIYMAQVVKISLASWKT